MVEIYYFYIFRYIGHDDGCFTESKNVAALDLL